MQERCASDGYRARGEDGHSTCHPHARPSVRLYRSALQKWACYDYFKGMRPHCVRCRLVVRPLPAPIQMAAGGEPRDHLRAGAETDGLMQMRLVVRNVNNGLRAYPGLSCNPPKPESPCALQSGSLAALHRAWQYQGCKIGKFMSGISGAILVVACRTELNRRQLQSPGREPGHVSMYPCLSMSRGQGDIDTPK